MKRTTKHILSQNDIYAIVQIFIDDPIAKLFTNVAKSYLSTQYRIEQFLKQGLFKDQTKI